MQRIENRIPPPIVALLVGAMMWAIARRTYVVALTPDVRYWVTALLAVIGLSLALSGAIRFHRSGTTTNPVHIERASSLVTGGIFRFTRNPMYLGVCTLLLAFATWLSAPWTLLGPIAFVAFITRFQIMPEERVMRVLFGDAYAQYCRRTRRWL